MAISVVIGMYIGSYVSTEQSTSTEVQRLAQKFGQILYLLEEDYLDSIDVNELADEVLIHLIDELDPHSAYVPKTSVALESSSLEKGFFGIGIEYRMIRDTLTVLKTVKSGPSAKAGILPGDQFLSTPDFALVGADPETTYKALRGEKGTDVLISILRNGKPKQITITRGAIPTYAVEANYLIDEKLGYIKFSKFAKQSYDELHHAIDSLKNEGMEDLILDLRNNGGGYLDQAHEILDEFIDSTHLLVYTKGKNSKFDQSYYADRKGLFESGRLVVLINENSASASEIVSGSIQDNDRGIIIGRRSFGKGLVQQYMELLDGSVLKMTISKYYTPSGRCIQKPYDSDSLYAADYLNRHKTGELYNVDSVQINDSVKFLTRNGRIVLAGGGIYPDIYVARDTMQYSSYLGKLYTNQLMNLFAIEEWKYLRKDLSEMSYEEYLRDYTISDSSIFRLHCFAESKEVEYKPEQADRSLEMIRNDLKALIARIQWNDDKYYQIINENDPLVQEAVDVIKGEEFEDMLHLNLN